MENPKKSRYHVYRSVIASVLNDQESLPSLPAITLKIRHALSDSNTTAEHLAQLIGSDPSLSALLMKSVSSPLYRTLESPSTLQGVISTMGFSAVSNVVMAHSINSLFVFRNPALKTLFNMTRQRQVVKGSISVFLARNLRYQPADEALMVSLLSEVGTLALLSAFSDHEETPDKQSYLRLCRDYGKSLGIILLTKWGVDENLIDSVRYCGIWDRMSEGPLSLLDIINLGLYHTAKITTPHASLPELNDLVAYNKLTPPHNLISQNGQLKLITENHEEIRAMIDSLQ